MSDAIQVGLLGCGTVGAGVVHILSANAEQIAARAGRAIEIKKVLVRDPSRPRQASLAAGVLTVDPEAILDDPQVEVVIELIGGLDPARRYIQAALERGKAVVTANKEVLAKDGPRLLALAARHRVDLYFEGAVAGGIPIIKPLRECLAANRIHSVMGIINGTTNYMLTRMSTEGRDFADVLREAQRHGYAEADPTSDVEGHDAAYKLAILAALAFETEVPVDSVHREGITRITPADIQYGHELGYVLKLLAIAKEENGRVEARVHPTFIPRTHPLAAVHDTFNAIFVQGDAVGELMFYGRGAGSLPTGSAVVADLIEVVRRRRLGINCQVAPRLADKPLRPVEQSVSRYYVALQVVDRPGVLASIAAAFGHEDVSIASVIQKGRATDPVDLVFVTHEVREKNIRAALEKIALLPVVRQIRNVIRVEGEG